MRWKPKDGDIYYYVTDGCRVCDFKYYTYKHDAGHQHYTIGNFFQTREQAEQAAVKVRKLLLSLQREV